MLTPHPTNEFLGGGMGAFGRPFAPRRVVFSCDGTPLWVVQTGNETHILGSPKPQEQAEPGPFSAFRGFRLRVGAVTPASHFGAFSKTNPKHVWLLRGDPSTHPKSQREEIKLD